MVEAPIAAADDVVGREAEVEVVRAFLTVDSFHRGLLVTGEPGIGKTTLWESGLEKARANGFRVLAARASEPEAELSFAGLSDLLETVEVTGLPVPGPQLRALEVALQRTDAGDAPPAAFAISAGLTAVLRALAARQPVLVAVDDLPWLDRSSLNAIAFAAKRMREHAVRFLLARRPGEPSTVEGAFESDALGRLDVGPLSFGATRLLLSRRLELSVPRPVLRRVFEAAAGNPMFALEIGRTLLGRRPLEPGDDLPVPDTVEVLLGTRVQRLPAATRRVLLATALGGNLDTSTLAEIAGSGALEDALDAGVVVVDTGRVRASHALLAAAAVKRARDRERRELHLLLASAVVDEVARARHLALAAPGIDQQLADRVAGAATVAGARGATQEALTLWEHALRLTPPGAGTRPERVLALAHHLAVAGEKERVTDLLVRELDTLPPGSARARAWLIRPGGVVTGNDEIRFFLERALEESRDDPALHAGVLGNLSFNATCICVERIREAETWARDALVRARRGDPAIQESLLYALACARSLRGVSVDDICERFERLPTMKPYVLASPQRIAALRLVWRGELDDARALLSRLLALADERGEAMGYAHVRMHLCELEIRAGRFEQAQALLDEWADPSERGLVPFPFYERFRALLASGLGRPGETEHWASQTIALAEAAGERWDQLEGRRARAIAALQLGETERAAETLAEVWEHTLREGVDDPGTFPVAPDLVEALVELGELDRARQVSGRLERLARRQSHPWGLATSLRCEALVALGSGLVEEAVTMLEQASQAYATLGLHFDEGRTLLALGRSARRQRKRSLARRSLEQAATTFEAVGAPGWVEAARAELERVGGRRPTPKGILTPAEEQVARAAAEGLSNKEIAGRLVVSVYTVERHLKHAYVKLGIRSRSQLAGRL